MPAALGGSRLRAPARPAPASGREVAGAARRGRKRGRGSGPAPSAGRPGLRALLGAPGSRQSAPRGTGTAPTAAESRRRPREGCSSPAWSLPGPPWPGGRGRWKPPKRRGEIRMCVVCGSRSLVKKEEANSAGLLDFVPPPPPGSLWAWGPPSG